MKYLVLFIFTVLLFMNNDSLALWEQDEAAYAGFAYNMIETGNYMIPDFEWSWPHRKPPLHFWLIAGSYSVFGYNEFATRIPSVFAILISTILLYFFSKRLYNAEIANWTIFVFMGSLLVPLYGKISMTDATLLLCFIGSYFSILSFLQSRKYLWIICFIGFTSFGALTKGPPIFITVFGSLGLSFLFGKDRKLFLKLFFAAMVSLIPFIIWIGFTWIQDEGKFIRWWFDWYILKRTTGTVNNHTGFIGYYFVVFIICFFPWILFLPHALKNIVFDFFKRNKSNLMVFQTTWLVSGWLFYEIMTSKLPSYAFAVLPIWCIYIAQTIVVFKEKPPHFLVNASKCLGLLFLILGVGIYIFKHKIPYANFQFTTLLVIGLFFSLGFAYLLQSRISGLQNRLPELALLFALSLNFIAWGVALPAFESQRRFPKTISEKLAALNYSPKYVFFSADYSMSSLPVYLAWKGFKFHTAAREEYEKQTFDSLRYSKQNLFMLQRRNIHYLNEVKDSFKLTPMHGFISDRGVVDTFFIAERKRFKASRL